MRMASVIGCVSMQAVKASPSSGPQFILGSSLKATRSAASPCVLVESSIRLRASAFGSVSHLPAPLGSRILVNVSVRLINLF